MPWIPGPVIYHFSAFTAKPWQWVLVCLVMCIGVEGVLYQYWKSFGHPFRVSFYLNIFSTILGIPLGLVSIIDPSLF